MIAKACKGPRTNYHWASGNFLDATHDKFQPWLQRMKKQREQHDRSRTSYHQRREVKDAKHRTRCVTVPCMMPFTNLHDNAISTSSRLPSQTTPQQFTMALVGILLFCTNCGSILERYALGHHLIKCDVCSTLNKSTIPCSRWTIPRS